MDQLGQYAKIQRLSYFDPNGNSSPITSFKKYSRDDILGYLQNPARNASRIIDASIYLYSTVTLYQRLCKYFADMPTYDYIVAPTKLKDSDLSTADAAKYRKQYFKVLSALENMNIKKHANIMAKVAMREGAFFGVEVSTSDSYTIYRFPHDYCRVTSDEDGCPMFSVDLSYFDQRPMVIETMGGEMQTAYNAYKNTNGQRWYEPSSSIQVCILADESLDYIVPPLSGCFADLYLIDNYKDMASAKTAIDIYKLISMKLPTDKDGKMTVDDAVATKFYNQVASQLPDQIGLGMSPFEISEVSFNRSTADADTTARAERDLFASIGVSQMIFSNEIASSTALVKSLCNDFSYVAPIIRSIEAWLNRKLKQMSGSIKFKVIMPDVTMYNRADYAESIRKDMQYGVPCKGLLAAVNYGYTPMDTYGLTFLENQVLDYPNTFIPPQSANTQSGGDGGRPAITGDGISDEGDATREADKNA